LGGGAGFNDVALTPAMNKKPNIAMANAFFDRYDSPIYLQPSAKGGPTKTARQYFD
jgi:hypothetical protein